MATLLVAKLVVLVFIFIHYNIPMPMVMSIKKMDMFLYCVKGLKRFKRQKRLTIRNSSIVKERGAVKNASREAVNFNFFR